MTNPGDPPTALEARGAALGITFTRGRTRTSNSHLSLEAAEFAIEEHPAVDLHRPMFKAYFEDLEDIGDLDTVVRIGASAGLPEADLRAALETGRYRQQVDDGLHWSHEIGVSAVPTFVIDDRFAVVGAQELDVFEDVLKRLGHTPRA